MNVPITFREITRRLTRMHRPTILAILVLAMGIGTGTAMFALLHAAVLERLPFPEPDRLVQVWSTNQELGVHERSVAFGEYSFLSRRAHAFEGVAYYSFWFPTVSAKGNRGQTKVAKSSASLFDVLGVAPTQGRALNAAAPSEVVLSHKLAVRLFGVGDGALNEVVVLDGAPYTAIGVMPRGFKFPSDAEAWVPVKIVQPSPTPVRDGFVIGRLRDGVEIEQLNAELGGIAKTMAEEVPGWQASDGLDAVPLQKQVGARVGNIVLLLFAAVSVFFMIACLSAAQLLFVESLNRVPDLAVRAALGANRRALRAQLFVESAVIVVLATATGLLLAGFLVEAGRRLVPPGVPRLADMTLGAPVLLFMLGLSTVAVMAVGLLSGWRTTKGEVAVGLSGGGTKGTAKLAATRAVVSCSATAGIILLTFGAVAATMEMWRITHADLGFEPEGVFATEVCTPKAAPDATPRDLDRAFRRIEEALAPIPEVRAVALADGLPVGSYSTSEILIEGVAGYPEVRVMAVSHDYFRVLSIPIIEGETFPGEAGGQGQMAIVNEAFGRRFWPDRSPLGMQLKGAWDGGKEWVTIVGVTADVRRSAADSGDNPQVYLPAPQEGATCGALLISTGYGAGAELLRSHLWDVDGRFSLSDVRALDQLMANQSWRPRLRMAVLGLFSALALLFGAVALYATLQQVVASRQKELATRAALGATPSELVRLVLRTQLGPVGVGIILGALGSYLAVRFVGASFHGIESIDPTVLASVCAVLAFTASAATLGPAIHAGRADVMAALKEE